MRAMRHRQQRLEKAVVENWSQYANGRQQKRLALHMAMLKYSQSLQKRAFAVWAKEAGERARLRQKVSVSNLAQAMAFLNPNRHRCRSDANHYASPFAADR